MRIKGLLIAACAVALIAAPSAFAAKKGKADNSPMGKAAAILEKIKATQSKVVKYSNEARADKDIMRVNCLSASLVSLRGLYRTSADAREVLAEAITRKDEEGAAHEQLKLTVAEEQAGKMLTEAEACVGDFAVYTGDTEVDTSVSDKGQVQTDPFAVDTLAPFADDEDGASEPLPADMIDVSSFETPSSTPIF